MELSVLRFFAIFEALTIKIVRHTDAGNFIPLGDGNIIAPCEQEGLYRGAAAATFGAAPAAAIDQVGPD